MFYLPRSCWGCQRLLTARDPNFCSVCALSIEPLDPEDLLDQEILTLYRYDQQLSRLLCALKYRGQIAAAKPLGALMWSAPANPWRQGAAQAVLLPVPLHPLRRLRRGFNQSEAIVRWSLRLAKREHACALPRVCTGKLHRLRSTPPQKGLGRHDRLRMVKGLFTLRGMERFPRDTPIYVVDDVCTTGATLRDCLRALREAGFHQCRALALLWAESPDGEL